MAEDEESPQENMKTKWAKLDESVDKMLKSQRRMIGSQKYYLHELSHNERATKFIEMGLLPLFGEKKKTNVCKVCK